MVKINKMARKKTITLKIYFNNGNTVTLDNILKWEVKGSNDGGVSALTLEWLNKANESLIVSSINLDSIDCITVKNSWFKRLFNI